MTDRWHIQKRGGESLVNDLFNGKRAWLTETNKIVSSMEKEKEIIPRAQEELLERGWLLGMMPSKEEYNLGSVGNMSSLPDI